MADQPQQSSSAAAESRPSTGTSSPAGAAPTTGVLSVSGSSSPFSSSRSNSTSSPASSPRKPPHQQQQSDLSSRRGSLSSLHPPDSRDPSKPVKPTSSFPLPQHQQPQGSPDPPASPARLRTTSLRSPRDAPAGGAFSSPNAAAAAATATPVPAAQPNANGEGMWPLSSSAQSMLPPSAIAASSGSGSPPLPSQGFSMPLTSRLSSGSIATAGVPPLPPASVAHDGGFGTFLQHQSYVQQLLNAQQHQQPESARQLFAPATAPPTHAMQSAYLQRMHQEAMHDAQQRFLPQTQAGQPAVNSGNDVASLQALQFQLATQLQQQQHQEQQQQSQQQQQRRNAPANVVIPRPSYASAASYLGSQLPSSSPVSSQLLPGTAVSASPLVYYNHVQAGSRDSLAEADDDEEEEGDPAAGEGTDSEGYAIRGGAGNRRRGRGSSSSDGDGSPSEHRERIGAMGAASAAAPGGGGGSSQRVGFAVGSDSSEDLQAMHLQQGLQSESANAGLMRKAQSAADFKSFSSRRGGGGRSRGAEIDLGVLTPFYSSETGTFVATAAAAGSQPHSGSLGASANASSSSLSTMRASTSHAVLSSAAMAARGVGGSSSRGSSHVNTAPGAPLVAQFSLGGGAKYNGQVRGQRRELAMVTEKLREMAYEVSRLHRKIKEYEEESEQWSLRYSRRLVILSNLALGGWIFLLQMMDGIKARVVVDSWANRLFIPSSVFAAAAAQHGAAGAAGATSAATAAAAAALAKQTGVSLSMATSIASSAAASAAAAGGNVAGALGGAAAAAASSSAAPLSAVLISGFLTGVQSSLWFLLSAALQMKTQSWKRNTGFTLSTSYSLFLILFRRGQFRPASANVVNILANLVYIAARYYFLHGLLVFNSMRIL